MKKLLLNLLRRSKELLLKLLHLRPNLRGALLYPPGHFYSPLLDIQSVRGTAENIPFDGMEDWKSIELHPDEQRAYYADLIENFVPGLFPTRKTGDARYFTENTFFPFSDAFTLSGIIRKEKPRRIVEVGSGFSSALMLDTLAYTGESAELTFIEPYPDRLSSLLSNEDRSRAEILVNRLQDVPLALFDKLDQQDILFIDSSHVAKLGSDVSVLLLQILPQLKPGVLIHFHDIFYPFSYPVAWIKEGRAWNESLFLRAFLIGNSAFQIIAFNSFAAYSFPELFKERLPSFLTNSGGSIWLRKKSPSSK